MIDSNIILPSISANLFGASFLGLYFNFATFTTTAEKKSTGDLLNGLNRIRISTNAYPTKKRYPLKR